MTAGAPVGRLPRVTLSGQVAGALRDAVLSGGVMPGAQMNEADLAARFGTSRGPIREALARLVQEGLLVSHPHRGVFVAELAEADLADIYLAREAIEGAAMRRVLQRPDRLAVRTRLEAETERMEAAMAADDWSGVAEADLAFHAAFVGGAESPRLSRMFETVQAETRLCLHLLMAGYRASQHLGEEHRRLARLATGDDPAAAEAELARHLANPVAILRRIGGGEGARGATRDRAPAGLP